MQAAGFEGPPRAGRTRARGFTLVETLIALAITGVLVAIAVPAYRGYVERARVRRVVAEVRMLEDLIDAHELEHRTFPFSLTDVGNGGMRDPWGRTYRYLRIAGPAPPPPGQVRKDKNLVPLNSDYDLYSVGPDGLTKPPLTAKDSRDDILRANDGAFVGAAGDY